MIPKTFYDTLQVSRHASPSVIRAAYRALSQKHHPDKNPDALETALKYMKRLNEANDVLSDPARRAAYDEQIEELIAETMRKASSSTGPSRPPDPPQQPSPPPQPRPSPPTPTAAPATPPAQGVGGPGWMLIGIVIAALAAALISNASNSTGSVNPRPNLAPQSAQALVPEAAPTRPDLPVLAVAAVSANVRKEPTAKSKAIGLLARGTPIEQISTTNGFVNFKLPDGREGWIARDVVVPRADAIRLSGLSAADYANARVPLRGIEQLFAALEPYREQQVQALFQVATESTEVDRTLAELANKAPIRSNIVDLEAASWYSLEARYSADNGNPIDEFQSARAAVFANPASVDAHVALAYAAIKAGEFEVVKGVASVLPTMAPNSTNTWVIVGVSAAKTDNSALAINSVMLALRKSKNLKVTEQVLTEIAKRSSEPSVSQAINSALERWNSKS
ncbi:DnaJ domain-containing protein [Xylophilus sp. GOD-11R]|uniref:DnaJ domain-containing protein n=1 Tax=Xylophilus sp. GOD-11R TaxID=3089814 RepID=UPI00298C3C57|nr:DnaJ domain-containing protein [Xylophilus sp. GOD-11R]WPB57391.1 DnaJ domain-containing protein [Xylophilus sp. GOD-11R]